MHTSALPNTGTKGEQEDDPTFHSTRTSLQSSQNSGRFPFDDVHLSVWVLNLDNFIVIRSVLDNDRFWMDPYFGQAVGL